MTGPDAPAAALLREQVERLRHSQHQAARLLDIVVGLGADLDLDATLDRIVRAACELSGARYGALGVLGPAAHEVSRLITHGLTDAQIAAIGPFPTGHGIVGLLITDPRPLRLRNIADHPQAQGFPPNHPKMRSFLGVPVKIRDTVYGNLYLADKLDRAEFSDEDEQLVLALAGAAGVMIENARLYAETDRRRRWNAGIAEITQALLDDFDPDVVFDLIARRAAEVVDAIWTALVQHDGSITRIRAAGGPERDRAAACLDECRQELADAISAGTPRTARVASPATGPAEPAPQIELLLYPFASAADGRSGALAVAWQPNAEGATAAQAEVIRRFADLAALTSDLSQSVRDRAMLAVFEDRDRIARDLHDLVIQRLYAIGLSLQGARRLIVRPAVGRRVAVAVDDLDATIRDIRATIFELHHGDGQVPLRSELQAMAADYAAALPFAPTVHLSGPIDTLRLPPQLREHLTAAVREGLANAARHAQASAVDVSVRVGEHEIAATVTDNGVGIGAASRRSGLANLRERAEKCGGTLTVGPNQPTGTILSFRLPLPADD